MQRILRSMKRVLPSVVAGLLFLVPIETIEAQEPTSFYVSPDGNDGHGGISEEAPFKTFGRVLDALADIPRPWSANVVVHVLPGDYFLNSTIHLTSRHGGEGGHRLVFRNHGKPGSAVLIGGRKLDPANWRSQGGGIASQDLPEVERADIIYENRRKARKARFPDHRHLKDFPVADGDYFVSGPVGTSEPFITALPKDLNQEQLTALSEDLGNEVETYLVVWGHGNADWHKWVYPITRILPESGRIYVSAKSPTFHQGRSRSGNRYYIEGGLRLLDADGEFHFDSVQRRLYYLPRGNLADVEVICSTINNIVRVEGARNISFEGLKFACSGVLPFTSSGYTWTDLDAAMSILDSERIEVRNCHFKSTGQSALNLKSSHHNVIENCLLQYLGQSGIKLYLSDHNRIHNCLIHDIGLRRVYCEGVAIHASKNNTVSHLEIYNSARYGVTVRGRVPASGVESRPTRGNTVEFVRMHAVNQDSGDTGGLHMARINSDQGEDYVNEFNQIIITRSIAQPHITDEWKPTGVYLDHKKLVMNQSMRNIEVRDYDPRYKGYEVKRFNGMYGETDRTGDIQRQIMQHRFWNNESSTKFNCSWQEDFDPRLMEHAQIGLTGDFPAEYAPFSLHNKAPNHTR